MLADHIAVAEHTEEPARVSGFPIMVYAKVPVKLLLMPIAELALSTLNLEKSVIVVNPENISIEIYDPVILPSDNPRPICVHWISASIRIALFTFTLRANAPMHGYIVSVDAMSFLVS